LIGALLPTLGLLLLLSFTALEHFGLPLDASFFLLAFALNFAQFPLLGLDAGVFLKFGD